MILHTVKSSPFATMAIANCLELINENDTLLLIEDAVIATHAQHMHLDKLTKLSEQGRLMVLEADLDGRGIRNIIGKKCTYLDFVELAALHSSQLAW